MFLLQYPNDDFSHDSPRYASPKSSNSVYGAESSYYGLGESRANT